MTISDCDYFFKVEDELEFYAGHLVITFKSVKLNVNNILKFLLNKCPTSLNYK